MSDVVGCKKAWQVHSWDLQVGHGENVRGIELFKLLFNHSWLFCISNLPDNKKLDQ